MGLPMIYVLLLASLLKTKFACAFALEVTSQTLTPTVGGNIIGGDVAKPGSTPWLVSLRDTYYSPPLHFCGGTILNHHWVLTTASCVMGYDISDFDIVFGDYDRTIDEGYELVRHPLFKVLHPHVDYFTLPAYDVALIFVVFFHYSERIRPVKLLPLNPCGILRRHDDKDNVGGSLNCHDDDAKWDLEGVDGLIAGWGETETEPVSEVVREATITILSNDVCKESYESYDMDSLFCAANVTYGQVDACTYDNGGGLISDEGFLLGIYTYEAPCAWDQYPGIYVNISVVQEWIESIAFMHIDHQHT